MVQVVYTDSSACVDGVRFSTVQDRPVVQIRTADIATTEMLSYNNFQCVHYFCFWCLYHCSNLLYSGVILHKGKKKLVMISFHTNMRGKRG